MYIMFLDVTHQHSDKNGFHRVVAQKNFFAGLPPRTPPKWQLSLRQPTPDPSFSQDTWYADVLTMEVSTLETLGDLK